MEHTASQKWEVGHHSVGEGQRCTSFLRIDQLVRNKWPVTYRLDLWHASSSWRDSGQTRWSKLNGRNLRSHGRKPFQRGRCDLLGRCPRFAAATTPSRWRHARWRHVGAIVSGLSWTWWECPSDLILRSASPSTLRSSSTIRYVVHTKTRKLVYCMFTFTACWRR